ncbi:MAG: bacillithiol biosynthesis cysteine-adding enzyme BshC, partial [Woeseiaceae bacterium]
RKPPRDQLAVALREFATGIPAPGAAKAQIDLLRKAESVAVFAGQQAGLFTGPLYTVFKALTAERWAADLERVLAVPVVPCFWLDNDDHDFAEVDHIEIPCGEEVRRIRYEPVFAPAGAPVGRVIIDSGMESVIAELADAMTGLEHSDSVLDIVRETYAVGSSFSTAFARLWYRMFPDSRLVFASPYHDELKKLAAPLMERAVADDGRLFSIYEKTSERIDALGYHRQVRKKRPQTFLFYQRGKRTGILRDANGRYFRNGEPPQTALALQAEIRERPADFSPNVLLRPVMQNALFPVLGVVLGPAETAYYAQIGGLHDHFGLPRPAILPRTGVTIIEAGVARRLTELRIDLEAPGKHEMARQSRDIAPQLYPCGDLQERRFNILYYWSRHGRQFLSGLHAHWPPGGRDHMLLKLD